jgi:hypothetical protein
MLHPYRGTRNETSTIRILVRGERGAERLMMKGLMGIDSGWAGVGVLRIQSSLYCVATAWLELSR